MAWTKDQLQRAMRTVGWERMNGPGSTYCHPETGHQIDLGAWESGRFAWETYAEREQIPPKQKPVTLTGLAADLYLELSSTYNPLRIQAACANVQRLETNHSNLVDDIAKLRTAVRAAGLVDDDLLVQLARGPEYVVGYLIDYFEAFVPNGAH
jgi:hypothetical protein